MKRRENKQTNWSNFFESLLFIKSRLTNESLKLFDRTNWRHRLRLIESLSIWKSDASKTVHSIRLLVFTRIRNRKDNLWKTARRNVALVIESLIFVLIEWRRNRKLSEIILRKFHPEKISGSWQVNCSRLSKVWQLLCFVDKLLYWRAIENGLICNYNFHWKLLPREIESIDISYRS